MSKSKLKNVLDNLSDKNLNLVVSGQGSIQAGLTTEDETIGSGGAYESWFTISGDGFSFSDWWQE